jgi:anti-sigma28 factor (negative regulator of flagellin synthesis)
MQIENVGVNAYTNINKASNEQSNKAVQEKNVVSRVEELKKAVANGTYVIDTQKTAQKMLEELK